ncbi:hypothetical protein B0T10DRAFT_314938 [Thelonectria olida]|uniref:Uncharacterized protein n=1 Tax=Thelonectria olida TaxID=1576542 RepID=A0A9P8W5A4_9HYPO|nr:hypothetical protein B0T10DRAFT_314938 [Thelonectria olida]
MATLSPTSAADSRGQEKSAGTTPQWPFNSACFDQVLDYEKDVADAFKDIEKFHLSNTTSLYALQVAEGYSNAQESILDDQKTAAILSSAVIGDETAGLRFFAATKVSPASRAQSSVAADKSHGKLQISSQTFRLLLSSLNVPVAFVTALARPYMVCGAGFRRTSKQGWDHWCLIPVRMIVPCRVQAKDHTKSTAGSNQLDPFHYIHLSGAKADIRGSYIGLFTQYAPHQGGTTVACFSLLDHRLRDIIEEPLSRVRGAVRRWSGMGLTINPHFIHLVYLSSVLRWWNNVLLCFNQELVMHEKQLQKETAADTSAFSHESKDINTSLHTMAAHLYRYKSELHRVENILSELRSAKFATIGNAAQDNLRIEYLMSQLNAIRSFSNELESKVQNILALLFNQIQVTNDRTMQAILTAAQEDNKMSQSIVIQSHELAQSMKNDSVAMKTIAILTMLFLPGTSFAAIFAMPFFTESKYLQAPAQVWIWTILTVAVTLISFGIFAHIIRRQTRGLPPMGFAKQDVESGVQAGTPLSSPRPPAVAAGIP